MSFSEYLNKVASDWKENMDESEISVFKEMYEFINEQENNTSVGSNKQDIINSSNISSDQCLQQFKDILNESIISTIEFHKNHNNVPRGTSYQKVNKYRK